MATRLSELTARHDLAIVGEPRELREPAADCRPGPRHLDRQDAVLLDRTTLEFRPPIVGLRLAGSHEPIVLEAGLVDTQRAQLPPPEVAQDGMTTPQPLEMVPDIGRPEAHDATIVPRPPATSKPASTTGDVVIAEGARESELLLITRGSASVHLREQDGRATQLGSFSSTASPSERFLNPAK